MRSKNTFSAARPHNRKPIYMRFGVIGLCLLVGLVSVWIWEARHEPLNANHQTASVSPEEQATKPVETTTPEPVGSPTTTPQSDTSSSSPKPEPVAPTPSSDTRKKVTPIISYLGYSDATKNYVEVDAWVPGTNELAGTCTLTASRAGQSLTKQTDASSNVQTMSCANFLIPASEFAAKGTWDFVINYSSVSAEGSSAAKSFEVQ